MIATEALPPAQLYIVFLSFLTVSVTMLNNLSDDDGRSLPHALPTLLAFTTSLAAAQILWGLIALLPDSGAGQPYASFLHMGIVGVAALVFWKWTSLKTEVARELRVTS